MLKYVVFLYFCIGISFIISRGNTKIRLLNTFLVGMIWPISLPVLLLF
ncbi:GhoT/OrtT family toxin, partial [Escherichia coli]|nr:GhoT/OrtT family toxin [Escherichia coli]